MVALRLVHLVKQRLHIVTIAVEHLGCQVAWQGGNLAGAIVLLYVLLQLRCELLDLGQLYCVHLI